MDTRKITKYDNYAKIKSTPINTKVYVENPNWKKPRVAMTKKSTI